MGILRKLEKDTHLVYLTPCDKQSQTSLIAWAQIKGADAYYKDFNDLEQMFPLRRHKNTLEDLVEKTQNDGWKEGKGYVPKENIKRYWQTEIKAHKKHYGYNPFYGTQMEDVIGLAKTSLLQTPIIKMIDILSKVYSFDPSWAKKQIAFRPNYPHPDDYAKYTNYFYFITMCSIFGGFRLDKAYLRDWEYVHYLPFCQVMSADKRFFKRLKQAMKNIGTDQILGIAIPDRIRIWGEDNII